MHVRPSTTTIVVCGIIIINKIFFVGFSFESFETSSPGGTVGEEYETGWQGCGLWHTPYCMYMRDKMYNYIDWCFANRIGAGVEGPTLVRHIIICIVTASTKHSRVKYEIRNRASKLCGEEADIFHHAWRRQKEVQLDRVELNIACPVHAVTVCS